MSRASDLLKQAREQGLQIPIAEPTRSEVLLGIARSQNLGEGPSYRQAPDQSVIERAWENLPSSAGRRFSETGELIQDLQKPEGGTNLMKAIARLGIGAGEELGGMFTPVIESMPSPDRDAFRSTIEDQANAFTKEGFAEDPTRSLSTLAAFVPSPAGKTGIMKAMRVAGQSMDPVVGAMNMAGGVAKTARGALPLANRLTSELFGITTGAGGARGQALVEAGRTGRQAEARASIAGRTSPNPIGENVIGAYNRDLGTVAGVKEQFLGKAGDVDISDLKQAIVGDIAREGEGGILNRLRIKVQRDPTKSGAILSKDPGGGSTWISLDVPPSFRAIDEGKLETLLTDLLNSPNTISVKELDEIKQGFDVVNFPKTARKARRAVSEMRDAVRAKLGEVEGFDEVSDPVRDFFKAERRSDIATKQELPRGMENTSERLGVPTLIDEAGARTDRSQVGKAVTRAFNKGDDLVDRLSALDDIERRAPGTRASAAGVGFQGWTPSEIVGRSSFYQAVGPLLGLGLIGGAGATGGAMAALLSLPAVAVAFVPKFSGKFLVNLGRAEAGADALSDVTRAVIQNASRNGINAQNLTIGQLLERLEESQGPQPTLMGRIGATNR